MNFFDLFAGIGGFRLAFENEGYKCVGFCEIDKFARKLYKAYFQPTKEVEIHDARNIIPELLPDFEVLTAGFPCQPFSIAGNRRGFEDTRGTLFFEIVRIARVKKPTFLVLENVKGLLGHNKGRTFEVILQTLDELGYDVEWQVLNSKDFGVPQNRERVFIIGHLREKSKPKVFPIRESDKIYFKPIKNQKKMGNVASTLTARQYANWQGNFVITQWRRSYLRILSKQQLSPTLTANMGLGGLNMPLLTDFTNLKIRKLTPLECFRLQGFPDDIYYKAKEIGVSDTQLYKQTGNTVTIQVVQTIARKLKT